MIRETDWKSKEEYTGLAGLQKKLGPAWKLDSKELTYKGSKASIHITETPHKDYGDGYTISVCTPDECDKFRGFYREKDVMFSQERLEHWADTGISPADERNRQAGLNEEWRFIDKIASEWKQKEVTLNNIMEGRSKDIAEYGRSEDIDMKYLDALIAKGDHKTLGSYLNNFAQYNNKDIRRILTQAGYGESDIEEIFRNMNEWVSTPENESEKKSETLIKENYSDDGDMYEITVGDKSYSFDWEVEYDISGGFTPSTHDDPAEYPDVDIDKIIISNIQETNISDETDNGKPIAWEALPKETQKALEDVVYKHWDEHFEWPETDDEPDDYYGPEDESKKRGIKCV